MTNRKMMRDEAFGFKNKISYKTFSYIMKCGRLKIVLIIQGVQKISGRLNIFKSIKDRTIKLGTMLPDINI